MIRLEQPVMNNADHMFLISRISQFHVHMVVSEPNSLFRFMPGSVGLSVILLIAFFRG